MPPSLKSIDVYDLDMWQVGHIRRCRVKVNIFNHSTAQCSVVLQVWQNILQLWEYTTEDVVARGRRSRQLVPLKRRFVDRSASSAVFVHFGFDKYGHMPYDVFIHSLTESPSRLLGHELLLNKTLGGKNGVENLVDVAYLVGDAKVDYPKSTMVQPFP